MENKKLRLIITGVLSIGSGLCLALLSPLRQYNLVLVVFLWCLLSMVISNFTLIIEWVFGQEL